MTNKPVGISYSGGASSRWMIDSLLNGAIDRPEHVAVFFADTGDEHEWTYEDVAATEERCRRKGDPQPSLPGFGPPGCDGGACFL